MLIKQIITTTLFLGGTLTARAENLTLQITKGVTVSSAANYRILVEDFAENQNKYCQDWPEITFKKKAYLAEACTLKDLTQIYYTRLDGLKNSEESGLEIPQILESGPDFRIPDAYLNSQAIGHAAYRNGFDAIVSPSAMNESIKNVIIFIKD